MLPHIVRRITSNARRFHCIHNLITNHAFSISSSGGPIHLDPASDPAPQQRHSCVDCPPSPITMTPKQCADTRLSRSDLAILLNLMLLAGLAGCGPASPDNAPSLESRANVSRSPLSKQ